MFNSSLLDLVDDLASVADAVFDRQWPSADGGAAIHEAPALNIYHNDERVVVTAELPGVASDALDLQIDDTVLSIAGRREESAPAGGRVLRREHGGYQFQRRIQLPWAVDAASAEARLREGVLVLALQRRASDRPQRISVAS